jgi:signal transduction histidine kinase/AmiR/NasT family two-component response regulator
LLIRAFKRCSLRQQIIVLTGGTILLFGCLSAEFVRRIETNAFERNFVTQTDKLVEVLAATSLDAILSEDQPELTTTIESLIETDTDVQAVKIYNDVGSLLASWSVALPERQAEPIEKIDFSRHVVLNGRSYGRFEVSWNVTQQLADLKAFGQRIYLYAAVLSGLLSLIVVSLVNALVGRPIRKIDRQLKALEAGQDVAPLSINSSCELSTLGQSINDLGQILELRRLKELELEEASRAKSELLANMSHELRTPMNGVLGMLNLLNDSPLSATQAGQVRIAASSGQGLLRLINDILDFSKVEAGKLEFEAISFDLEALVEETLEIMAPQAHGKGLEIEYEISGNLRESTTGDPTRIRQVLTNLIGNAIKFTASGAISVKVDQEHTIMGPPLRDRVRFTVTDTGIGIDKNVQASVFESFKQADGSTTRLHGGTGLGLAISRQLTEGMNGHIGVDSVRGVGSTFWFELDLPSSGRTFRERARSAVEEIRPTTAVVLDHSKRSVSVAVRALRELGVEAEGYHDSEQALRALRESVSSESIPELLIIGDRAGDMPRDVFTRCLESDPVFDRITLVALTQLVSESSASEIDKDCPIALHLARPIGRGALTRLFWSTDLAPLNTQTESDIVRSNCAARYADDTILVVEDNPVNQQVALGMLQKLGFKADVVNNGREALDRIAMGEVSLVLMDCQMPVLDGYAATTLLRASETESNITRLPVIALTANVMQGDYQKCLDAGMDDYLAKPFDPAELEEKLVYWLEQRAQHDTLKPLAHSAGLR